MKIAAGIVGYIDTRGRELIVAKLVEERGGFLGMVVTMN